MKIVSVATGKLATKDTAPLFLARAGAGFASLVESEIDTSLNLHSYVVEHPEATFFVRVEGDSMEGAGIFSGDLLVVDRAREAKSGCVVLAVYENELTVKRLRRLGHQTWLYPENPTYEALNVTESEDFSIWGVVTHSVRAF